MSDMSKYSKEHWDEDTRRFAEDWTEFLCKAIIKMIDGVYDKDVENFKEEYGEVFDKIKRLVTGNLEDEEIRLFIDELGRGFYNDINNLVKKGNPSKENAEDNRENIWAEFEGEEHSDDVVDNKTTALAGLIIKFAYDFATILQAKHNKETNLRKDNFYKLFEIFLETVYLYMNAVDRVAFVALDSEAKSSFMNKLMIEVLIIVSQMPKDESLKKHIMANFIDMCNKRQDEYGAYKISPPSDDNFKKTLFWEYGKKITKIMLGTEYDAVINVEACAHAVSSITAMQLIDFFIGNAETKPIIQDR